MAAGRPACGFASSSSEAQRAALRGRVLLNDMLAGRLEDWVRRHYRDRLSGADLGDPALLDESRAALDELTSLLALGSIYAFQQG